MKVITRRLDESRRRRLGAGKSTARRGSDSSSSSVVDRSCDLLFQGRK